MSEVPVSDAKTRAKEKLVAANKWLKHRHELASRPIVNHRSARVVVLFALVAKLLLVLWNGNVYDASPYDYHAHKARAAQAGLKVGKSAYNPALYYLPYVEDYEKGR